MRARGQVASGARVSTRGLFDERLRQARVVVAGLTIAEVIAGLSLTDSTGVAALVNGRLSDSTYVLQDGDEVLLIELISGGD